MVCNNTLTMIVFPVRRWRYINHLHTCLFIVVYGVMPGFNHSVVVLPLPFRRCRFRTTLPLPCALARRCRWLAGQLRNGTTEKIELDPISTEERLRQLFGVCGCNGTEFFYVIFTEQWNFTTAERRNGNGMDNRGRGFDCLSCVVSLSVSRDDCRGGVWPLLQTLTPRYEV